VASLALWFFCLALLAFSAGMRKTESVKPADRATEEAELREHLLISESRLREAKAEITSMQEKVKNLETQKEPKFREL